MNAEVVHEQDKLSERVLVPDVQEELNELLLVDALLKLHREFNSALQRDGCDHGHGFDLGLLHIDKEVLSLWCKSSGRLHASSEHDLVQPDDLVIFLGIPFVIRFEITNLIPILIGFEIQTLLAHIHSLESHSIFLVYLPEEVDVERGLIELLLKSSCFLL